MDNSWCIFYCVRVYNMTNGNEKKKKNVILLLYHLSFIDYFFSQNMNKNFILPLFH